PNIADCLEATQSPYSPVAPLNLYSGGNETRTTELCHAFPSETRLDILDWLKEGERRVYESADVF
ncbi:MAG TPA: hypothetical protein VFQ26_07100, partial [Nitrospiraceae bacterium]|nr:hypothetical protein [Nitrospiraceae bacterium]